MKNKPLVDKRGKPKLQLKGRIFMQNVTDVVSTSKQGMSHQIHCHVGRTLTPCRLIHLPNILERGPRH